MPFKGQLIGGAALFILAAVLLGAYWVRHRAKRLAEDHRLRYIKLFEHSPDMVICFDPSENRIVSANPAVYRLTGYSPEELNPTDLRLLYGSEKEMSAVREEYRNASEDNQPRKLETSIVNKEGRLLEVSLTVFPIELDGKRYIYAIGRDVTEQKRTERELHKAMEEAETANHIKGEFLAVMSHEIRTPLNGIVGINQILMETELTDKQREMLLVQEKSGQALLRIIHDVLDYSKIEAGAVTLSDEMFHLRGCLEESLESFSVAARNKGLELLFRPEANLPEFVYGDEVRLRQILINLIGNAVKFTESGSVALEARLLDRRGSARSNAALVEFRIIDTGIGIDPSKVHLLFLPFSQILDPSKGGNELGTGLGLAICRDLVKIMGGEIWVEAGRKQGAAFGFRLPFRTVDHEENVS